MKSVSKLLLTMLIFLIIGSCGGPDLLLINRINTDGSVSRKIIMTWSEDEFDLTDAHVPVDSTWAITQSMSISEKNDTVYTLIAEKRFESVEEINRDYIEYEGSNKLLTRNAVFERRFSWFNTTFYYSENIEKAIDGYPPEDFLTEEETDLFYMPGEILKSHMNGPDSVRYKQVDSCMSSKYDTWFGRSIIKAVMLKVAEINNDSTIAELQADYLFSKEGEMAEFLMGDSIGEYELIDTVFGKGFSDRHIVVIDSALSVLENDFDVSFSTDSYVVQSIMPGELVATNGYIDTENNINWKVDGDVILSKDYSMWAQSSVTNWWAWIISILFLLFVLTGFIVRVSKNKKT